MPIKTFSSEEIKVIQENYGVNPIREWLHLLNDRSERAVCGKANKLGLSRYSLRS